jgi:anti-sigma regulatory factor (Ser/Thr protein kinase)
LEVMIEVDVADDSAVAAARRQAVAAGAAVGFDELRSGQLAIVATELATNLVKHGGGGRLLVGDGEHHVDLLALDNGPGMADLDQCLTDGYSATGTPGTGLGAVRRLAQAFQVASWPQRGTAVLARLVRAGAPPVGDEVAGLSVAKRGEDACGDGWASHMDNQAGALFVVDGLGHGADAALAANEALRQFQRSHQEPVADVVQGVHLAMRHTRGGAVAAARIDWAAATVAFAGLGNIAASLVSVAGQVRHMVSLSGIAGHNARKIHAFEYPFGDGLLIMHSDGIGTGWAGTQYPGFTRLHPMLLAGLLYRDFGRRRDDATVVVARTHRS